jgi:hypothetical protein
MPMPFRAGESLSEVDFVLFMVAQMVAKPLLTVSGESESVA